MLLAGLPFWVTSVEATGSLRGGNSFPGKVPILLHFPLHFSITRNFKHKSSPPFLTLPCLLVTTGEARGKSIAEEDATEGEGKGASSEVMDAKDDSRGGGGDGAANAKRAYICSRANLIKAQRNGEGA